MSGRVTRRHTIRLAAATGVAAFGAPLLGRHQVRAAGAYDFVDIGEVQPDAPSNIRSFYPTGINEDGKVTGTLWVSDTKNSPYVYSKGKLRKIKTGKYGGRSAGINNDGTVAGRELTGWTDDGAAIGDPAIWVDGEITLLAYPDGLWAEVTTGYPLGINTKGSVTGGLELADGSIVSVLWEDEEPAILPAVLDTQIHEARAINDDGVVAGAGLDSAGNNQPVYWQDGVGGVLPTPEGGLGYVERQGIGTDGSFTGASMSGGRYEATIWRDGEYELLPSFPGDYAYAVAEGANRDGVICGRVVFSDSTLTVGNQVAAIWDDGGEIAVIWREGIAIDLATLVETEPGVQLVRASAINDAGQIIGGARWPDDTLHAFLLNPR